MGKTIRELTGGLISGSAKVGGVLRINGKVYEQQADGTFEEQGVIEGQIVETPARPAQLPAAKSAGDVLRDLLGL